jgi:acyl-CoA synthetase (AMP-forming)/AMP-acid ligase II
LAAASTGSPIIAVPPSAFDEPPSLDRSRLPSDDACGGHILLTSGTTGRYKKIMIDCSAEAARAEDLANLFGTDQKSILFMGPMGLWTSAGHNRPVMTWYRGGCVVVDESANSARTLMSERVTQLQVTVPFLTSILDQLPLDFRRNDDVRIGLVGSSPSWALVERTQARLSRNIHIELRPKQALSPRRSFESPKIFVSTISVRIERSRSSATMVSGWLMALSAS